MVHGRGCNPHRSTTTFAKPEMTSLMTSEFGFKMEVAKKKWLERILVLVCSTV